MYVKEIWRYPAKSMAGERVKQAEVTELGLAGDRRILVIGANGSVVTARTHPKLLGLKASLGVDGVATINGHPWNSAQARELIQSAAGPGASVTHYNGPERFDVLPLLVATDGAIEHMKIDGRRLRPNLIIGGVEGLSERNWPGRRLRIGDVVLRTAQLRGRCVMTTFDPDTLQQDLNVLRRIAHELDGTIALDTAVEAIGEIREGDPVSLLPKIPA
jgi:uncharacterized protein YcbX